MTREEAINKLHGLIYGVIDRQRIDDTCREVIDYLKAQEPRVLALDEIHRGMVVWLEDKDKPEPILAIGGASAGGAKCFITVNDMSVSALDDEYNIRWRAWTDCPSKEEMGATPWG